MEIKEFLVQFLYDPVFREHRDEGPVDGDDFGDEGVPHAISIDICFLFS